MWQRLGDVPERFMPYGGTALALLLGHRRSMDFDFFSTAPLEPPRRPRQGGGFRNAEGSYGFGWKAFERGVAQIVGAD